MSDKLRRSWPLLLLLQKVKPGLRKRLVKDLAENTEIYHVVRELFVNYMNGNIKLNKQDQQKLKKHMKLCKEMTGKATKKQRKRTFQQVGGLAILPLLIKAAIPLITSLLMT